MYSESDPLRYADMLHLPHPRSETHPPMSAHDRAAQFSPFAALTGHSDAIAETGRLTEEKIDLIDDRIEELNARLHDLAARIEELPAAVVTYFVPDAGKPGGKYRTVSMRVRRIDTVQQRLCPVDGDPIAFSDLLCIEITE